MMCSRGVLSVTLLVVFCALLAQCSFTFFRSSSRPRYTSMIGVRYRQYQGTGTKTAPTTTFSGTKTRAYPSKNTPPPPPPPPPSPPVMIIPPTFTQDDIPFYLASGLFNPNNFPSLFGADSGFAIPSSVDDIF